MKEGEQYAKSTLSRRKLLVVGGATLATMALFNTCSAQAAPLKQGEIVLPPGNSIHLPVFIIFQMCRLRKSVLYAAVPYQ